MWAWPTPGLWVVRWPILLYARPCISGFFPFGFVQSRLLACFVPICLPFFLSGLTT